MKDLIRLAVYGGGTIAVSVLLYSLYKSEIISGGAVGALAVIIVVVLPVVYSVMIANRERNEKLMSGEE